MRKVTLVGGDMDGLAIEVKDGTDALASVNIGEIHGDGARLTSPVPAELQRVYYTPSDDDPDIWVMSMDAEGERRPKLSYVIAVTRDLFNHEETLRAWVSEKIEGFEARRPDARPPVTWTSLPAEEDAEVVKIKIEWYGG